MRAATRSTPNDSLATRAAITLELSPLLTAANASAFSIPASIRTSRSNPTPVTLVPLNPARSLRKASTSWSITATVWPRSSRMCARVDPTRPHPKITMCMIALPCLPRRWYAAGHHSGVTGQPEITPAPGEVLDLRVGEAAAGGWCVARLDDQARDGGFVVFVRHALPGELVRAVITQCTSRFARADAVEIVQAAAERVRPPCPYARPGGCGGCDWQHASLPAQRALKAQVLSQQLRRIAGIDREVTVEPFPSDGDGLGWRTRVRFAVGGDGQAGLHRHRSNEVIPVADCLIAHPLVTDAEVTRRSWPGAGSVEVAVAPHSGQRVVIAQRARAGQRSVASQQWRRPGSSSRFLTQHAAGRDWRVSATGFWQVHPQAADTLAAEVLAALRPRPGETALDLFCGAGLFAGVLAEAVGPSGQVIGVEQDQAAAADARHNLRGTPWARVHHGDAAEVI